MNEIVIRLALKNNPYSFFSGAASVANKKPILENIRHTFSLQNNRPKLSDTYLIGVQHFLPSTVHLFKNLIQLGFPPENMAFSDKPYSRVESSFHEIKDLGIQVHSSEDEEELGYYSEAASEKIRKMWATCSYEIEKKKIKKIIILDEGGRCIEHIPNYFLNTHNIVAIEQTRGGLYSRELPHKPFPVIELASSAIKKNYESPIISKSILKTITSNKSLKSNLRNMEIQYGIVGNGTLGLALASYFSSSTNRKIFAYDKHFTSYPENLRKTLIPAPSAEAVIRNSDCIFFCTGQDSTKNIDVYSLIKNKVFISCSSEDIEFRSILREISRKCNSIHFKPSDSLGNLKLLTESNDEILLAAGGFPINFDRTPESDPEEMLLTRGLLMGAVIQAIIMQEALPGSFSFLHNKIMLDPFIQKYILKLYKHHFPSHADKQEKISLDWIQKNSGGNYINNKIIENIFNSDLAHDYEIKGTSFS
jgi:hypothetical protein